MLENVENNTYVYLYNKKHVLNNCSKINLSIILLNKKDGGDNMKNKKTMVIIIIILCVLLLGFISIFFVKDKKEEVIEILPEEEISDEQLRKTMISLYYENKETKKLMPEARLVDVKLLINEPYKLLIDLLIEEPKNSSLRTVIPKNVTVNKIELNSDVLYIDFSKEFIENHEGGLENETNTIYSIVNTLTELTEVNGIKILIDNKENMSFKDEYIKFDKVFTKEE